MKVLVFIEQRGGTIKSTAKEALTAAYLHSGKNSENCAAVIIGTQTEKIASELKDCGADQIFTIESPKLSNYHPEHYADALEAVITEFKPQAILGIASPLGRDLFPKIAARLDCGLMTDLVALQENLTGGSKPMFAGKVLANMTFESEQLRLLTIRPNSFMAESHPGAANIISCPFEDKNHDKIEMIELCQGQAGKIDLSEATKIISGGRSLGSADNFKIIEECAKSMGAAVGASRAAVDAGYASHDMQVGQTGKTVNPNLYIACGISGAIQHMAGMKTSKIIVAINTDKEASIFSVADYGIVADLFEAVPILTEKLKQLNN